MHRTYLVAGVLVALACHEAQEPSQTPVAARKAPRPSQVWAREFDNGFSQYEAHVARQTPDGGFIVGGFARPGPNGGTDCAFLKLNSLGELQQSMIFGDAGSDIVTDLAVTADGGYVAACHVESPSFGVPIHGPLIIRLNAKLKVIWARRYQTSGRDWGTRIEPTSDGGFVFSGGTDPDLGGPTLGQVVKLAANGDVQWSRTFGPPGGCCVRFNDARRTVDGGYVAVGLILSEIGGNAALWVVKLDASGNMQWQQSYSGAGNTEGIAIRQFPDGRYFIVGATNTPGNPADAYALLLASDGPTPSIPPAILDHRMFGGADDDAFENVALTADGGAIAVGSTVSFGRAFYDGPGAPGSDVWVVKFAPGNTITSQWQLAFDDGFAHDDGFSVVQASDGGYVVAGGNDVPGPTRALVLKLPGDGTSISCPNHLNLATTTASAALTTETTDAPAADATGTSTTGLPISLVGTIPQLASTLFCFPQ